MKTYECLIIGAGSTGRRIARILAGEGRKSALLSAGPESAETYQDRLADVLSGGRFGREEETLAGPRETTAKDADEYTGDLKFVSGRSVSVDAELFVSKRII